MVKEDETTSITNVRIRQGTLGDFDDVLKLLINFYSKYETLSVHLGIRGEEMSDLLKVRLKKYITTGACAVAEVNGKVEGVFMGRIQHRNIHYETDYLQLPDQFQTIEKLSDKLEERFWERIPPKFNSACFMDYGIVTPAAQGLGIGDQVLKKACKICVEKGVYVVSSASLTERTAKWALEHGFALMNELSLDQLKDKNGHSYIVGRPEKTASLLVAFFDDTTTFFKSKL